MNGIPLRLVDGEPSEAGWPLDRGLQFGDGLFETLVVRDGRVRFRALHQQRLAAGCARLQINLDAALAWHEVDAMANGCGHGMVKLLVTRGDALERGYAPAGGERARRVVYAWPAAAPIDACGPAARAVTLAMRLGENPLLAGMKHTNRLEQVLARAALHGTGALEGLMAASSGHLVSGTMSNVFVRLAGQWCTPPLERCGIAGVMRSVVLREAPPRGLPIEVRQIELDELARCEGLFVTNVRLGVQPVGDLDGRPLPTDAAVSTLQRTIAELND